MVKVVAPSSPGDGLVRGRWKLRITCNHCGANLDIDRGVGETALLGNFASELSQKCPEIITKGTQDGSADHWTCNRLIDQIAKNY